MQRKKERKNLRSSETAAPHVGSIKKTSFAVKSETRLQSDFGILKFQFRVFSNFVESEFREFLLNFMDPRMSKSDAKSSTVSTLGTFCQCLNFWSYPRTWFQTYSWFFERKWKGQARKFIKTKRSLVVALCLKTNNSFEIQFWNFEHVPRNQKSSKMNAW